MASKLSVCVPVTDIGHWPHAAYYTALGRWRARRPDRLRETVLVAGSPRSGTTWLGDVVAGLTGWSLLHEPTHAHKLPEMRDGHGWDGRIHRPPDAPDPDLAADLERVVTATYLGPGVVKRSRATDIHLWARRPMVTKVIDTNLLLPWMARQMPWLRTIHVVRHPLEVIASQEARTESIWARQRILPDPYRRFMATNLGYDAPAEFETVAECLVTEWAIEHAWLRDQQPALAGVLQVRYEDLRADLFREAVRINGFLDLPAPTAAAVEPLAQASRAVNRGSATIDSVSDAGWRTRYDREQRDRLRAVLARYGHPFYGPETMTDTDLGPHATTG